MSASPIDLNALKPGLAIRFDSGTLRTLIPRDVHAGYVAGLNDPAVNRFLVNVRQYAQTAESVTKYVEENLDASDAVLLGVWPDGATKHIGTVRLHGVDWGTGCAHLGICLFDRSWWGRGIGAGALHAFARWATEHLCLDRIVAGVYEDNIASAKAFIAAGFDWVDSIPNRYTLDGRFVVVQHYAYRSLGNPRARC